MSVDLSGLKVGTAWRVETTLGPATLVVSENSRNSDLYYVIYDDRAHSYDFMEPEGRTHYGHCEVLRILHELKPVADITAADLDGMVIETADGGYVFIADGHACVYSPRHGGEWGFTGTFDKWFDDAGCEKEELQAAYAAELERRRNPPVEIVWLEVLRIGDKVVTAHCCIRDDVWRLHCWESGAYAVYRGLKCEDATRMSVAECEQYIRDHYASKDRATQT